MKNFDEHTLPEQVQDWIDGAESPEAESAVRLFLEKFPEKKPELYSLRDLAAQMRQMGDSWRETVGGEFPDPEDLPGAVMLDARLESMGNAWRAGMPEIHLERDVMALLQGERRAVAQADENPKSPQADIVPLRSKRCSGGENISRPHSWRERSRWMFRAAAVLAVCGLAGTGWILFSGPRQDMASTNLRPDSGEARQSQPRDRAAEPVYTARRSRQRLGDSGRAELEQKYDALPRPVAAPVSVRVESAPPEERSAKATLTLPDLIELKKRALAREAAAARQLKDAGALTADEARQLLSRADISLDAFLGAVQYLPSEEAADYLRRAVEQYPDSPYLRYLLAKNLAMHDATREEALVHLAALRELDPGNGLPNYLEARERLRGGDLAGAITALDVGSQFPQASAFSVESARTRAAALQAAGRPAEESNFAAAAVMGEEAYAELVALGQELLAQARELEAMREYETAQSVTESVMALGKSLAESSPSANEQLAGADIQMDALDFWVRLAELIASSDGVRSLTSTYQLVAESVGSVVSALGLVSSAYESADPNTAATMAQQALQEGDLAAAAAVIQTERDASAPAQ